MKRNPRKLAWTKSFRSAHGKEMTVDSTLTFAARRNVPVRYNRELVATTLKAMKRVGEIRQRRERAFYKKRMEGNKERTKAEDRKLVAENSHLLPRERVDELEEGESMDVDGEKIKTSRRKGESKRRLLVGGGVEESMEVD
jgi:large subunit ribosomal protein L24e